MSIKDIFFGEKNIQLLSKILGEELNIDDTKVARAACKNFVVTQMKLVFKKNEDKIMNADPKKILPKLNDKAVTEALKVYSKSANTSGGKGERSERSERSEKSSNRRNQKPSGPQAMYSGGGDSGYAPIVSGEGGYITATGELGKNMFFGNIEQQMSMGNKQSSKDEIDRLVLMRRSEYEGGDDEYGMGNDMGGGGMMNPAMMGYGYNPMANKRNRPSEINFCVDGGDTRGIANGSVNDGENGFNPMAGGFGMMGAGGNTRGGGNGGQGMYPGMGNNMMGGMNPGMNMGGGMPGMMGPGMMGGNPMMNGGGGNKRGNNADIEARMAQMEADRNGGSFDTGYNPMMNQNMMGGQNGMMNPNMMGGMHPMMNNGYNSNSGYNNQNFQMGGRGGNSELEELVKDKKRELAQKIGLDPEALMNLSREQIESLMNPSDSESESEASDDSDDSNDKNLSVKEMLIRKLKNKRMNNEKNHKKLNTEVKSVLSKMDKKIEKSKSKKRVESSDESEDNSDNDSHDETDKKRAKHNKKSKSDSNPKEHKSNKRRSDKERSRLKNNRKNHSDDSESDQSRDTNSEDNKPIQKKSEKHDSYENVSKQDMKVKKRDELSSKMSVTKSVDSTSLSKQSLNVKSDAWTEPQFYNNYQVSLKNPLQNLKKIVVKGASDFPLLRPAIDEKHNTFCIIYKKDSIPIELDPDDGYVLSEIIDGVNEALKAGNIPIVMKVDKKGQIIVENTKGEKFDLDMKENSMGPYLGFQEQEYRNKIRYVSECPHMFLDQSYYMFIKEISPDDPVCEITPDGKVIQLIDDLTGSSDLKIKTSANKIIKTLTFQYRYNKNNSSDLIDFYEEPHEISFELLCQDESKNASSTKTSTKHR